jgi:hypothetical protein
MARGTRHIPPQRGDACEWKQPLAKGQPLINQVKQRAGIRLFKIDHFSRDVLELEDWIGRRVVAAQGR